MIGIYKITSPTNRIYIGQSVNIENRFKKYKYLGCKTQTRLYRSLKKYGVKNHLFEILEECKVEDLNERERFYQDMNFGTCHKRSLNSTLTKTETKSGYLSKEVRNKIGKKQIGVKLSDSHRKNISLGKKGVKLSLQYKKQCSLRQTGVSPSQKTREKISLNSGKARIVLNTYNGIYYNSIVEAAKTFDLNSTTLSHKLIGRKKNNTAFIYA